MGGNSMTSVQSCISKFITTWISLKTDKNNAFWTISPQKRKTHETVFISRNDKFLPHRNIHNKMYMYQFVFRGLQTLQCQSVVRAPVTHGNTETEDDGWVCGVLSDISSHVYRKGITMYLEKQIVKMIIYSDVFFWWHTCTPGTWRCH